MTTLRIITIIWESRDFRPESSVANTPELEGPQISSASSLSIKQVHCTDPPWSCARGKKATGKVGRAPLTSTGSSPRAGLHHLTLSPRGIGRNKPPELRASCPLISLARYPCAAHNRSNYTVQSCLIKGKPPPRALEKERNPKKCSFGSHYIFWTTSENQSSAQIPVPSLICSVTWISLFNLSIPQLLPHKMGKR